ncbi:unnamed protein product [Caenorhabditis angaria]|uniref:UBC core domain-containing protein n=1 Tax=Caenorhabditis angaria TaxID=860376 RepID=A0A9P1IDK6_9PELO|nr:unnamed protein product [Caenorhabditis angaria]
MQQQYNTKCAGVKRLMREAMELREPTELYHAQPLEDNLFEWHFTVRGASGSDYEGGIYHGRLLFPVEYPMKPPNMILLTPNGRFELNTKICLSISGHHPETWLPSWSARTCLLAIIGFMPTAGGGALGSLEYPKEERRKLAKLSGNWTCDKCQCQMKNVLLPVSDENSKEAEEAKTLGAQLNAQKPKETSGNVNKQEEKSENLVETVNAESELASENENLNESPPAPSAQIPTPNAPAQIPAPSRISAPRPSDSTDYSLFVIVPLVSIAIAILVILIARRILIM